VPSVQSTLSWHFSQATSAAVVDRRRWPIQCGIKLSRFKPRKQPKPGACFGFAKAKPRQIYLYHSYIQTYSSVGHTHTYPPLQLNLNSV